MRLTSTIESARFTAAAATERMPPTRATVWFSPEATPARFSGAGDNAAAVIVTHQEEIAERADRWIRLRDGKIEATGTKKA